MKEVNNTRFALLSNFFTVLVALLSTIQVNAQASPGLVEDSIFAYSLAEAMKDPERVTGLFIYEHDVFPKEVLELVNLRRMGVVNCKFMAFPEAVSSLKKVESIEFAEMEYVPQQISKFPNIKVIMLPNATLLNIPEELKDMKELSYLAFRYQDSVIFPTELRQIKGASFTIVSQSVIYTSLCALPSLERIQIEGIKLDISACFLNPSGLKELYISHSTISDISIKLDDMNSLKKVEIEESNINAIISELLSLPSLSSLTVIDCDVDEALVRKLDKENKIGVDTLRIRQKGFTWESHL